MNLSTGVKITQVVGPTAAGTTAVEGTVLDMQGFEGVLFLSSVGTAAANNGIKAAQGAASDGSDAADLEGSLIAHATIEAAALDVYRPAGRYVQAVVVRGTSTTVDAVWAIQYGAHGKPQVNTTAAQLAELHVSPAEGTA